MFLRDSNTYIGLSSLPLVVAMCPHVPYKLRRSNCAKVRAQTGLGRRLTNMTRITPAKFPLKTLFVREIANGMLRSVRSYVESMLPSDLRNSMPRRTQQALVSACTGWPSRPLRARSAAVLSGTSGRVLDQSAFLSRRNSWRLHLTVILERVSKR